MPMGKHLNPIHPGEILLEEPQHQSSGARSWQAEYDLRVIRRERGDEIARRVRTRPAA